jgi:hypothetical protein
MVCMSVPPFQLFKQLNDFHEMQHTYYAIYGHPNVMYFFIYYS